MKAGGVRADNTVNISSTGRHMNKKMEEDYENRSEVRGCQMVGTHTMNKMQMLAENALRNLFVLQNTVRQ